MATYVNVTIGDDSLLSRIKDLQQANRLSDAEKKRRAELEARKEIKEEQENEQGRSLAPTPYVREPAAHRHPGLMPMVINWRGVLTGGEEQTARAVLRTVDVPGSVTRQDIVEATYTGGAHLDPHPIRFATDKALVSVDEEARTEPFQTVIVAKAGASYTRTTTYPNHWMTAARHTSAIFDWQDLLAAPTVNDDIGPVTYTPTLSMVSVAANGTAFLTFRLPDDPRSFTRYSFVDFDADNWPRDSLVTDYPHDIYFSSSFSPWLGRGVEMYMATDAQRPKRFLFVRVKGTTVASNIAEQQPGETWNDFMHDHAYQDDPGFAVREVGYQGEFRMNGQTARILRLRRANGTYLSFPFDFLTAYRATDDGVPDLSDGSRFEDHVYTLPTWSSATELRNLLNNLDPPGGSGTTPDSVQQIRVPSAMFQRAVTRAGNDGDTIVTPNLFVAIKG